MGYAPASGVAVMAAELVHLDPVQYLVSYQLTMAAPVVLVMALTHVIVQRYYCLLYTSDAADEENLV